MFGKESKGNIELLLFDVCISFYSVFFFLQHESIPLKKSPGELKKKNPQVMLMSNQSKKLLIKKHVNLLYLSSFITTLIILSYYS